MLNISSDLNAVINPSMQVALSAEKVIRLVRTNIRVPQGNIQQLPSIGKFLIYIYTFDVKTRCSTASAEHFDGVEFVNDIMPLPRESMLRVTKHVAWSFFSLVVDQEVDLTRYFDNSALKFDYVYPKPLLEDNRMKCLYSALLLHYKLDREDAPAKMTMIDPKSQTEGYCQFSGGGDIRLHGKLKDTLVINTALIEDVEGISPIYDGTLSSMTMTVEGKRGEADCEKMKCQLLANMMLASITTFINEMPNYDEAAIQNLKQITGYGIPYTGFGDVGFYILQIEFGKNTKVVTKIQLNQRPRPYAAALVDYLFEYYFKKLKTNA